MQETLLQAKLHIPPLRPNLVSRQRLLERLNQGLQTGRKLTIVSAPAGYGKTTSLIEWAHSTRSPIGWLSLNQADNDFECFFRYLVTAWEEVQPGIMESPLGILVGTMSPDNEAVLAAFINLANELANHSGFILDDYQLIEEPAIHQALTFLLDHLPPKVHFVLAGRGEPPLPVARYRARGELLEIGVDDLRFHPDETELYLNSRTSFAMASDAIEPIQPQLEGWVAGLQMVALGLKRGLTEAERLNRPAVTGRQRFIMKMSERSGTETKIAVIALMRTHGLWGEGEDGSKTCLRNFPTHRASSGVIETQTQNRLGMNQFPKPASLACEFHR